MIQWLFVYYIHHNILNNCKVKQHYNSVKTNIIRKLNKKPLFMTLIEFLTIPLFSFMISSVRISIQFVSSTNRHDLFSK